MHLTRKIDRAFQWAGEKIGGEKTAHSEEFKNLETEMTLRYEGEHQHFRDQPLRYSSTDTRSPGMDRLQKSTNGYVKWITRRGESYEDKEKALPIGFVGRMMVMHGEDFDHESEYGNSLVGKQSSQNASQWRRWLT